MGSIDKIARMDRESGMRSLFVGRPDDARPEGQNRILGVSKVEEGERGGFCLGGAKLNPFTPAIPAANSVSVEGIWLQLREFNRVVVNDHLGGIDKFELLCSGLVAFRAFIEPRLWKGKRDFCGGLLDGSIGPPSDGLAGRGVSRPRQNDSIWVWTGLLPVAQLVIGMGYCCDREGEKSEDSGEFHVE